MLDAGDVLSEKEARLLSPLALAFVGDAVQTLYVRRALVAGGKHAGGRLHRATAAVVKAVHQADVCDRLILPELSEAEADIYRRGRNHKNTTTAKNAGIVEYKKATGFEAVVGYLYLTGRTERLRRILELSMKEGDV